MKITILISCLILSGTISVSAQNITTRTADEVLIKDDSTQSFADDSLGAMTREPLFLYFKKTLVHLNELDTVTHYTYIQRNYSDQFLRIYDSEKILPASLIHSFYRDHRFYRSVSLGNRFYGFAEKIESGKMNLFCLDDILIYDELKAFTLDANHPDYTNYLLVLDADRRKNSTESYLYFISFDYNQDELLPITPKTFAKQYLKACPKAVDYLNKSELNTSAKTLNTILKINFVASALIYFIAGSNINHAVAGDYYKHDYFGYYVVLSGVAYFVDSILIKNKKSKRKNIQEAVKLYNACLK